MPRKSRAHRGQARSVSTSKHRNSSGGVRDISRILDPAPTVEHAADGDWYVQYMPAVNAVKTYTCPECSRSIPPQTAHLVVWEDDHLFGQERAVAERRHWHRYCWQSRSRRA
ncbi:MAG: ATP/GTP-binding protein [Rothia sp. (in: high G+C Gram-positive bacteria)]|nr:ATP/GTP-binding protein [Rothia sp. (in: high G+C Gram-positive bacteria)]